MPTLSDEAVTIAHFDRGRAMLCVALGVAMVGFAVFGGDSSRHHPVIFSFIKASSFVGGVAISFAYAAWIISAKRSVMIECTSKYIEARIAFRSVRVSRQDIVSVSPTPTRNVILHLVDGSQRKISVWMAKEAPEQVLARLKEIVNRPGV